MRQRKQRNVDTAIMSVTGHRVQLQQVLFNLITNAIEAMETVADRTMLVKSEHENSGQVRVTVEDSGTGIEPQHVDKIFGYLYCGEAITHVAQVI